MSIRIYKKDHLKQHADVAPVVLVVSNSPESGDPLVFWTQHEKEPHEVNLHPFATGQEKSEHKKGGGFNFIPFSGRPELILQLTPAIEESLSYSAKATVKNYMHVLRAFWRILDEVESAAATAGQTMARVESVGQLTQMHLEHVHRSGMAPQMFVKLRSLVDITRQSIGLSQTYWESPEVSTTQKHIPSQEQRNALRFEIRRISRDVLLGWENSDRLSQLNIKPDNPQETQLWKNARLMREVQKETGKTLPKRSDLPAKTPLWAINTRGSFRLGVRNAFFPDHRDADAVWSQCLLNTGWNPSTLTTLDVTKNILQNHFKDLPNDPHQRYVLTAETYELIGEKERSGGKEQFITGQWKSLDGPGHLIKTYLERVAPLRNILKEQLVEEKRKYETMKDAPYQVRAEQFAQVKALEQGTRSVWLYVTRFGDIKWITENSGGSCFINGKGVSFLEAVVYLANERLEADRVKENIRRSHLNLRITAVNSRRVQRGKKSLAMLALLDSIKPLPQAAPKDFRIWFADYVVRKSNGNMLHLQRALNHSRLSTSIGYTKTNIADQEASDSARRFLNILVKELESGRVDLTILAHLYRYGIVTPEQEEILTQLRTLPKSRMNVGCKDPAHPPSHLNPTAGENCDVQRCMLCPEHTVLLPESMDGIAMRAEELRALQGFLPIETWIEDRYDIELKNNLMALRKFDLNQVLAARKKWANAIDCGDHYVPGLPLAPSTDQMELA